MSYYIKLNFKDLKEDENVIDIIMDIKNKHKELAEKIIEKKIVCIPSLRCFDIWEPNAKKSDLDGNLKSAIIKADDKWLNDVLTIKVFYWKKYNLIAFTSHLDEIEGFKRIEFQNQCDRDYEREYWSDIKLFEEVVKAEKSLSLKQLKEDGDCDDEEYCRRTWIYDTIFDKLDLGVWAYQKDKSDIVQFFNINCIDDIYDEARLSLLMKNIRKNYIEEFNRKWGY